MKTTWAVTGVAVAAFGSIIMSAPALAADIPDIAPVEVAAPPPPPPSFSWNGPYVGVFGVGLLFKDFCEERAVQGASPNGESCHCYQPDDPFGAGVQLGFNFGNGRLLFGVEGQIGGLHGLGPDTLWAVAANLRAGVVLGERILLYAEAGIGTTLSPQIPFATLGGGVEIALGDRLSIFGEAKAVFIPGGPGYIGTVIMAGLNIHFGR